MCRKEKKRKKKLTLISSVQTQDAFSKTDKIDGEGRMPKYIQDNGSMDNWKMVSIGLF